MLSACARWLALVITCPRYEGLAATGFGRSLAFEDLRPAAAGSPDARMLLATLASIASRSEIDPCPSGSPCLSTPASAHDDSTAAAAGPVSRSLEQALTDTLAREMARSPARTRRAGLSDDDELALLQAPADG